MRGRFSSFIGWLVFLRTVTWFVRVRYAVDRSGVVLTKPYCKRTRFIPGFPNSPLGGPSRWSFVLPNEAALLQIQPKSQARRQKNSPRPAHLIRVKGEGGKPRMPVGGKLSKDKIAALEEWVTGGAQWPTLPPIARDQPRGGHRVTLLV